MPRRTPFVDDGYHRARTALQQEVQREVHAEYAERLQQASFFERLKIKRKIRREINRRVLARANPSSLY